MPILEVRVELVDADARGTQIGVVASHAILREERLHNLIERRFERVLGTAVACPRRKRAVNAIPKKESNTRASTGCVEANDALMSYR